MRGRLGMKNPRELRPAAGVFLIALAYLLLLRPYGFQLEDEGTILFWFDRVLGGQRPYLDFHTGYTPGFFAFGKAVFTAFGPSATALRAVLAVMNALTAALLTEITRRAAGSRLAALPALLWLAFMPVYVGEFAAFNVPYPTWPVTLAWMVVALAMLAWMEGRRVAMLGIAGLAAAAAMSLRPNSGALALAACTWIVVAGAPRRSTLDRAAALAGAVFMAAGVWYTFALKVWGSDVFVHLLPGFAVAGLLAGPVAARLPLTKQSPGSAASLVVLAAAFLVPTAAWMLPLLHELGAGRFLYEVFLVGADYQTLYYKPHPWPEPYAALVVAGLLALAGGGFVVSRRIASPLLVAAVASVAALVANMFLVREGLAPEGLLRSVVAQMENASFWLAATASFGAVAWLAHAPAATLRRSPRARAVVVVAPLAVAMYMQMFPRSDFMHQVSSVPLSAALGCALLATVASWWSAGSWPLRWRGERLVYATVVGTAVAVLLPAFAEKALGPMAAVITPAPSTPMPARLDVRVEAAAGDELEAIASTLSYLERHADPGETLWSFPATSGLLFAAGATNAAPHDYWYPGRPDHAEEQRVLGLLSDARPRFIVTLNKGWNFFVGSPTYFEDLRRFVGSGWRLAARFGRYDVLLRRDAPGSPEMALASAPAPLTAVDVLQPNLERRRQAAWRWMDTMTVKEALSASLPVERRDALLLLRALRDGGDLRGTGWVVAGLQSRDARLRSEAVDASSALVAALDAQRHRLAGDFDAARYRDYVAPFASRLAALGKDAATVPLAEAVAGILKATAVSKP